MVIITKKGKPNTWEQHFIDHVADPKQTYTYHPQRFYFKDGTSYQPDFYCEETDTYIEVNGTEHAYVYGLPKYRKLVDEFAVNFMIMRFRQRKPPEPILTEPGDTIGKRIAYFRIAKGLTQTQLGNKARVPQTTLSDIEHNKIQVGADDLKRIATALNVPILMLYGEEY